MCTPEAPEHDHGHAVLGDVAVFADAAGGKDRDFVLLALGDQIEITVADTGGDGMAGGIHRHVVGGAGAAVDAVDHQPGRVRIADQIIEYRFGRG